MQNRKNIKYVLLFISLCLSITDQTILTRDKQDQDERRNDRRNKHKEKRHNKKNQKKEDRESSKEEGYFENIGERTGTVIEDTGLLAGSLLGFGREKKGNDDSKENRSDKKRGSKKDSRTGKKHKKEEKRDGYVENVGKRTGNTVKDTGMLAGSFLGLGRDKKDTNSNE